LSWIALTGALIALLALDLAVLRTMSVRTAAVASACWVAVAFAFAALLFATGGDGSSFLAGYLVEKSLSLDNVFVFLLIFSALALPVAERHRLLTYGIVIALVMRALFIVAGAAALHSVSWLSFVFAALLAWTGWKMFRHRHDHDGEQVLVARLIDIVPLSAAGTALVAIAAADLVFAVDSVPAILAITDDTFIVFAANAFALLGLRPLFFLVADLVERLYYLKTALAALLVFIGAKMAAGELVGKIGPELSLPVIAAILAAGVAASLLRARRQPAHLAVERPHEPQHDQQHGDRAGVERDARAAVEDVRDQQDRRDDRDGEEAQPGDHQLVRRLDHVRAVLLVEAQAMHRRRRDEADRRHGRADQRDVEDVALERRCVAEALGERHGQQEAEQQLDAGQRDAQLVQQLDHLPVALFLFVPHSTARHT
jgi:predicted tellurium resistance membrane protein TerC